MLLLEQFRLCYYFLCCIQKLCYVTFFVGRKNISWFAIRARWYLFKSSLLDFSTSVASRTAFLPKCVKNMDPTPVTWHGIPDSANNFASPFLAMPPSLSILVYTCCLFFFKKFRVARPAVIVIGLAENVPPPIAQRAPLSPLSTGSARDIISLSPHNTPIGIPPPAILPRVSKSGSSL